MGSTMTQKEFFNQKAKTNHALDKPGGEGGWQKNIMTTSWDGTAYLVPNQKKEAHCSQGKILLFG